MKQYILIALAVAAGRYVDVPLWQVVLTAAGAIWAVKQLNKDWGGAIMSKEPDEIQAMFDREFQKAEEEHQKTLKGVQELEEMIEHARR